MKQYLLIILLISSTIFCSETDSTAIDPVFESDSLPATFTGSAPNPDASFLSLKS